MTRVRKILNISLIATASLLLGACTSTPTVQSPSFKSGSKDGCSTAKGTYIKDGASFNNNKEYQNGWYFGRKNCNPSQAK